MGFLLIWGPKIFCSHSSSSDLHAGGGPGMQLQMQRDGAPCQHNRTRDMRRQNEIFVLTTRLIFLPIHFFDLNFSYHFLRILTTN